MLNVAIQAARFAPVAKVVVIKAAPLAKDLAIAAGIGVVINEAARAAVKKTHRTALADPVVRLEKFETHRPLWKKLTNTHADETYGQGVKRRGRLMWDIVTYGVGTAIDIVNFFTIQLGRLITWILGKAVYLAGFCVASAVIGVAFGLTGMKMPTFASAIQNSAFRIHTVAMAPYNGLTWVGKQVDKVTSKLMYNRSCWVLLARAYPEWFKKDGTPISAEEIVVDAVVTDRTEVEVETKREQDADIHHLVVALTADENRAKANPKEYGRNLAKDIFEKAEKNLAAVTSFRGELDEHCKAMQLTDRQSALVFQGYEEAMVRLASENATS